MYICTVPRGGSCVNFLVVILSELPITGALVCIYTVCVLLAWVGGRMLLWVVVGGGCLCVLIKISNMGLCMSLNQLNLMQEDI
jgi:hypothetical protein